MCQKSFKMQDELSHFIKDKENEIFVKLFPNPTTNLAFVHWGEADIHTIEIYDYKGNLLSAVSLQKNIGQYELTGLSSGEYFVRLILQNGSAILKKATFL